METKLYIIFVVVSCISTLALSMEGDKPIVPVQFQSIQKKLEKIEKSIEQVEQEENLTPEERKRINAYKETLRERTDQLMEFVNLPLAKLDAELLDNNSQYIFDTHSKKEESSFCLIS